MKLLVATDLSDDGDVAIDVGRAMRARHGGSIAIVHVLAAWTPEAAARLRARMPSDLSDSELLVEQGKPADRLLQLAAEREIDLIVLGGRAPSGKRVFGSVAEAILSRTTIPVLIARQHRAVGEIVAATDLTESGLPSVQKAVELAKPTHARVTVVHVRPSTPNPKETLELKRVRRLLPPTGKVKIETGDAASAIVAVAERLDAELIVVASRGRKGLARLIIGSVAGAVVRKASCSVLVVPLEQR